MSAVIAPSIILFSYYFSRKNQPKIVGVLFVLLPPDERTDPPTPPGRQSPPV
jgi:hypothetical protein